METDVLLLLREGRMELRRTMRLGKKRDFLVQRYCQFFSIRRGEAREAYDVQPSVERDEIGVISYVSKCNAAFLFLFSFSFSFYKAKD